MTSTAQTLRIFLVENHEDTATYMRIYLEQLGHHVEVVHGMQAALDRFDASAVDLLISDIGLPDGDGWEMMRQLGPRRGDTFAIAMSGLGAPSDKAQSLSVGYRHHLTKPFSPEELDPLLDAASNSLRADGAKVAGESKPETRA